MQSKILLMRSGNIFEMLPNGYTVIPVLGYIDQPLNTFLFAVNKCFMNKTILNLLSSIYDLTNIHY